MKSLGDPYRAVVLGASGGIGRALAAALRDDPACAEIRSYSRPALDLKDEDSIAACAADARRHSETYELILLATGILAPEDETPEKALKDIDPAHMAEAFAVNTIGPALVLKHFAPLLPRKGRSIFAIWSARVGSIGDNRHGGWTSYRASKAALNQIVHTSAIEVSRKHKDALVVAVHPGTVATRFSAAYQSDKKQSPDQSANAVLTTLDGLPASASGGFYAYDGEALPW